MNLLLPQKESPTVLNICHPTHRLILNISKTKYMSINPSSNYVLKSLESLELVDNFNILVPILKPAST